MLEFWGTWCGPCVQAMPHVQELHERYEERGLRVLAISYEDPEVMQPFLTQHAYTMTVGSDPTKKVVSAYGVKSWPTTYLIDPQGKIAFAGAPYDVEPAIEKALGLEANPGSLLTAVMGALQSSNKTGLQDTLARVIEKEIADFDLGAWARSAGGTRPEPRPGRLRQACPVSGVQTSPDKKEIWPC
jgi:thiol-disulfide isomerase/thioredoxin